MVRDHFLSAINDRDLELKVRGRFPGTLDEAFKHAVQLEALQEAVDAGAQREQGRNRFRGPRDEGLARRVAELERSAVVTVTSEDGGDRQRMEMTEMRRKMDEMSRELGRLRALQPQRSVSSGEGSRPQMTTTPPAMP